MSKEIVNNNIEVIVKRNNKEIANCIREYLLNNINEWKRYPYWALQEQGKTGWSDKLNQVYEYGLWAVNRCHRDFYPSVYVDCSQAKLVYFREDKKEQQIVQLNDDEIASWFYKNGERKLLEENLDIINIIEGSKSEANRTYPSYYKDKEVSVEVWRRRATIDLKQRFPWVIFPESFKINIHNPEEEVLSLSNKETVPYIEKYILVNKDYLSKLSVLLDKYGGYFNSHTSASMFWKDFNWDTSYPSRNKIILLHNVLFESHLVLSLNSGKIYSFLGYDDRELIPRNENITEIPEQDIIYYDRKKYGKNTKTVNLVRSLLISDGINIFDISQNYHNMKNYIKNNVSNWDKEIDDHDEYVKSVLGHD